MKFMLLLVAFSGCTALVESSLNTILVHPGVGGVYKGPNSETIIKGPDGSVITAQEEGGSVTQDISQPIVVADTIEVEPLQQVDPVVSRVTSAPIAVSPTVVANTIVSEIPTVSVAPVAATGSIVPLGHTIEVIQPDPHIIETEIVDAPIVEPLQSSDLVGPSGSISTRGSSSVVSGPASTTISEPARILVATPLIAAIPVISTATTPLRALPVINTVGVTPVPFINPAVSTVTVGPPIITGSSSPQILVSTAAPPINVGGGISPSTPVGILVAPTGVASTTISPPRVVASTTISPPKVASTTISPPRVWETDNQINARLSLTTPAPGLSLNPELALAPPNIGASIQPASSNGYINNLDNALQISSTLRPEVVFSSTSTPSTQGLGIVSTTPVTNLDLVNNRQLNINPSLIPSANIIPPEIGPIPPGAIDLGSTVTVSTTPRPPVLITPTESPNVQRITDGNSAVLDNNIRNIDGRFQIPSVQVDGRIGDLGPNQITTQNRIVLGSSPTIPNVPLLTETNPIPVGISRNGLIGSQLANYGIDSAQIGLTNVPLSSVSRFPQALDQEIDEVSAQLWNRYNRDVEVKKAKGKKGKIKEV